MSIFLANHKMTSMHYCCVYSRKSIISTLYNPPPKQNNPKKNQQTFVITVNALL